MPILLDLILTFARIGCFTFGGGYAMIALIEDICVERKKWITHDDMMNVLVIAESTPGPIAVNCATFVGYKQAGVPGAILATLGLILPSFLIMLALSRFLDHFLEIAWVARAFQGIKIAVGILIADAALTMLKKTPKTPFSAAVIVGSLTVMLLSGALAVNVSSVTLILAAAAVSLAVFLLRGSRRKDGQKI
ncbi:MAG: chromate transporter [Thermoguttaceae bacterium]|nr:chromate transporter [Thermoguttaceae bacterium]